MSEKRPNLKAMQRQGPFYSYRAAEDIEAGEPVAIEGIHVGYTQTDVKEGDYVTVDISPLLDKEVETMPKVTIDD